MNQTRYFTLVSSITLPAPLPIIGGNHGVAVAATCLFFVVAIPFALGSGCAFELSVSLGDGSGGSDGAIPPPPDSSSTGQGEVCQTVSSTAATSGESGAGSLEEFLEQSEPQPGLPGGKDRLYAGYKLPMFSMAAVSNVNAFAGTAIKPGTFSLMEMAVGCMWQGDENTLQLVGMVASRDHHNFKYLPEEARQLKLQVEFLTQGPYKTGPDPDTGEPRGGWHGSYFGEGNPLFVVKSPTTVAYPGANMQASEVGKLQFEQHFEIQLFNGDWWMALNGEWFGYYPAWKFVLMQNYTCILFWYWEVYDGTPENSTYTDAGSGEFADAGFGKAAYFRRIFYVDQWGKSHWLLPDKAIPVPHQNPN